MLFDVKLFIWVIYGKAIKAAVNTCVSMCS